MNTYQNSINGVKNAQTNDDDPVRCEIDYSL